MKNIKVALFYVNANTVEIRITMFQLYLVVKFDEMKVYGKKTPNHALPSYAAWVQQPPRSNLRRE